MKNVSLHEFQTITGLSDKAVLWLLKENKLGCQIERSGSLSVDIDSAQVDDLVDARLSLELQALDVNRESIDERLAAVIRAELDDMLEEALSRLL